MQAAKLALGESILNTVTAMELGYHVRHCEGIARCLKLVREVVNRVHLDELLVLIDYEAEGAARKAVDKLLGQQQCTCTEWVKGIKCCRCKGGSILIVLFENGPEHSLESRGYRLDHALSSLLKSQRLIHEYRSGANTRAIRAVKILANAVREICTKS